MDKRGKRKKNRRKKRVRGEAGGWVVTSDGEGGDSKVWGLEEWFGAREDKQKDNTTTNRHTFIGKGWCHHVGQAVDVKDPEGAFTVYAGSKMDMVVSDYKGFDVLMPLVDLIGPSVYSQGFKGRIWYTPAPDGGTWPVGVYHQALEDIRGAARDGRKVLVFCLGGHGRTGTMVAGLLGRYEKASDPIAAVRERYCKEAVEGIDQCKLVYQAAGLTLPDKYLNETGWWDYAYTHTPKRGPVQSAVLHPEAAATGGSTVKTTYGSLQKWDDQMRAPASERAAQSTAPPGLVDIRTALTIKYGSIDKLSGLVKRVLNSPSLQVLPGYTEGIWWVYGDVVNGFDWVANKPMERWEAFIMYHGHDAIPDGHITVEFGRTCVAPTMDGGVPGRAK